MNLLGAYRNGNYNVLLFDDGTKIRVNALDKLIPAFPESIDMKISNRCDMECPMCHEESTRAGALADLQHPLLDSIPPYTEIALGGGNVFEHPGLEPFLMRMLERKVVCNATVHAAHFRKYHTTIKSMVQRGLLHSIGVSVNSCVDDPLLDALTSIPNVVVHVIAGVVDAATIQSLASHGLKLLVLGYKDFGRGVNYRGEHPASIDCNIEWLKDNFDNLKRWFPIVSFDNLALAQLDVRNRVPKDVWERSYMGDDGSFTMYVDLVKEQYAVSSVSERHDIFSNDIHDLFEAVRREAHDEGK